MKILTCKTDSEGLYGFFKNNNYDNYEVENYIYDKNFFGYITKKDKKIIIYDRYKKNSFTKDMFIFSIYYNSLNNNFEIKNYNDKEKKSYDNTIWLRINEKNKNEDKKSLIKEGDIFRFGKQVIKITKINRPKKEKRKSLLIENKKIISDLYRSNKNISERSSFLIQNNIYCRICLEKETEKKPFEPLICKCSAKMPAHIDCLIKWIKKKCEIKKNDDCIFYYDLENLKCEVCMQKYPKYFLLDGEKINFLEFDFNEKKDYLSIDVLEKKNNDLKGKYIILPYLKNKTFSIGRNTESSIHFEESSVSRVHSYITFENNNFYIFDKKSKYGTLKKINEITSLDEIINHEVIVNNINLQFHYFIKKK